MMYKFYHIIKIITFLLPNRVMEFTEPEDHHSDSPESSQIQQQAQSITNSLGFNFSKSNNYPHVLDSLQKINSSFSLSQARLEAEQPIIQLSIQEHEDKETITQFQEKQTHTSSNPQQLLKNSKKSLIFSSCKSASSLESSGNKHNKINIYYFGHPIHKQIDLKQNDDAQIIIRKAINQYIKDSNFDNSLCNGSNPTYYQLRFCDNQEIFKPDLKLDPFQPHRKILETYVDALVLVPASKSQRVSSYRKSKPKQFQQQFQNAYDGLVKLQLHNIDNIQIASIIVHQQQNLNRAYQYVQEQLCQQIYLTQTIDDQFYLPNDYEVKNLKCHMLYVKKKKYLDEPAQQIIKPLRIISHIPKDLSQNFLPPIGISEASRYEEFEVIKINRRGTQQFRILGIDQTKIYNYDANVRKQKTETSSFLSLFSQQNPLTGTKQPQRLVSSMHKIQALKGLNFMICFNDKNIEYIAKNPQQKQKILRKLRFLLNFHQVATQKKGSTKK